MRKTSLLLGLFGLFAVASFSTTSAHAQATRTWVSGVGDDANPCSRTAPCKTFAGAISKTAAGGQIDCLDPGGFGAITITKSMTIDCGPFAGGILNAGNVNGVIVNAGANDKVVLRNLLIQGTVGTSPGLNGIRFLAGRELVLNHVFIQGQNGFCIDVNKTALGILYVKNSFLTECATGINLTSTATLVAAIETTTFAGLGGNGVAASGAAVIASVTKSAFENIGTNCMVASTSGATVNAADNMFANCAGVGMNASASGAIITATDNRFYNNGAAFAVAAGGVFLSGGDNKVAPVASAGPAPTGTMTTK
jgi:hypothetical protein